MLNETSIKMQKIAFCYEFFNLTYRVGGSNFKILIETSIKMKKKMLRPHSHDFIRAVFQFKQQLLAE